MRRHRCVAALVLAMALVVALPWRPALAAGSLFESMGGADALHASVDRFATLILADDRINFTFAEADMAKFKRLLFDQLCEISGGPCHYGGRDMRTAHAKLGLTAAEFNALAEDLYAALNSAGVSHRDQNRLMALLAPMERQIVKPRGAVPRARDGL